MTAIVSLYSQRQDCQRPEASVGSVHGVSRMVTQWRSAGRWLGSRLGSGVDNLLRNAADRLGWVGAGGGYMGKTAGLEEGRKF